MDKLPPQYLRNVWLSKQYLDNNTRSQADVEGEVSWVGQVPTSAQLQQ